MSISLKIILTVAVLLCALSSTIGYWDEQPISIQEEINILKKQKLIIEIELLKQTLK